MVYLQSIKMTGFKSFGNSTKVVNLAPGFTCIVGPNGSGKSNTLDAINFCLGTLSKKSMRADKLTDLLYNGSKKDKTAEKAIVEIKFDNSDRKIPIDSNEVVIYREVRRNGSGVYRLNGKRTTRSDILDILRVAGIDCVDGFNIIQQGQIGEVVGMSGIQRRELLEGVAGVGQFDEKKESSIAELDEAQRKMGELTLLVDELTERVETLKKEKKAAEQWLDLSQRIKQLKSELLSVKLFNNQKKIQDLNQEIDKRNQQISDLETSKMDRTEIKKLNQVIDNKQDIIRKLTNNQSELSATINENKIHIAKLEQLKEFTLRRKSENELEASRIEIEIEKIDHSVSKSYNQFQQLVDELKIVENKEFDLKQDLNQLEKVIKDRDAEHGDAQDKFNQIEKSFRSIQNKITKLEVSVDVARTAVTNYEKNKVLRNRQIKEIENDLNKMEEDIVTTTRESGKSSNELEKLKERLNHTKNQQNAQNKRIDSKQTEVKQVSDEVLVLNTKIEMLRTSIKEQDEENDAVSYLLEHKNDFPEILGSLEQLLGGDENFPSSLRYNKKILVTKTLDQALKCIKALKDNFIGACDFLPLNRLGIKPKEIKEYLKKDFTPSTILVNDIEEAIDIWDQNKGMKIQTAMGDIFYPNGIIVGGFHQSTAVNQLQSFLELQKIKKEELEGLSQELKQSQITKARLVKTLEVTQEAAENLENSIRESILKLQHLRQSKTQAEKMLNRFFTERSAIETAEIQRKTELEKLQRELDEHLTKKKRFENELDEAQDLIESLDTKPLRDQYQQRYEGLLQLQQNKFQKEERRNGLEKSINFLNDQISQLNAKRETLQHEVEAQILKLKEIEEDLKLTLSENNNKIQELQKISAELNNIKKEMNDLNLEIKKLDRENLKINSQIQLINDEINKCIIKRVKYETETEALFNEASENELEIFEVTAELKKRVQPRKYQNEINSLSNTRKDLEPVNMRSVEAFKDQNTRLQQLLELKKILAEERDVILDFIVQLEIEKTNTFMRSFKKINKAFNEIFYQLSGGNARLIIENEEDIFTGGISIEAHPAGKKLKTLEAMSGGEKALTALAFIFAIQQSESQPFYVLDEIDAFLDVKNVDKVARLIAKMAEGKSEFGKAQFLVISHRDILMAKADTIYGTTNVEGITHMMQVQLEKDGLVHEVTRYKEMAI